MAEPSTSIRSELDRALADLPILVVDLQTTGATPERGTILDAAWIVTNARDRPDESRIRHTLVAQPDGASIPRPIARLTGLTDSDLTDAVSPADLWAALTACMQADGRERPLPLAHCASFEDRFLRALHVSAAPATPYPFEFLCTLEIARRLYPDLPRRGLRALSGYFGLVLPELKRARAQVLATMRVWSSLVDRLEGEGVHTLGDLHRLVTRPSPRRGKTWAVPLVRDRRLSLPDAPGVYRLLGPRGEVLYVGKARSLRTRVNSYYRRRRMEEKLLELISQVREVRVTRTRSALEAAIVEDAEIKHLAPPYNRALRDRGRSVWYFTCDLSGAVPGEEARPGVHRVGPFPSRDVVDAVATIGRCLDRDEPRVPDVASARTALGLSRARVTPETLVDGLARFAVTHALRPGVSDPRHLFQLGTRLWRERRDADGEDVAADVTDVTDATDATETARSDTAADPLDADGVARHLEWLVISCARLRRRARVLRLLGSSTLRWTRDPHARELHVRDGRLDGLDVGDPAVAARARGGDDRAVSSDGTDAAFLIRDRVTYDRLRVLMTEIRRLARDRDVTLRIRGGPVMGSRAIARMLADA